MTEGTRIAGGSEALETLRELRAKGLTTAVNDLGTGYSSLGYLRHLELDALKFDRSFMTGVPGDPRAFAVAAAVIQLGRSLEVQVIAGGIESAEQQAWLRERGAAQMQGYLFSRPPGAVDFERWPHDRAARRRVANSLDHAPVPVTHRAHYWAAGG